MKNGNKDISKKNNLEMKMEEEMIKKIISVISIIGIVTINIVAPSEDIYAKEIKKNESEDRRGQVLDYTNNANNLIEDADENNAMTKILNENKKNNSGILSEEIEITLNEIGVFDDEIQDFPDELVNLMENGYNYSVYINYSAVNSDGAIESLSEDEINEYFEEKLKEEKKDKLESLLGIESVNVSAKSATDIATSKSGMLKQLLTLSQTSAGGKIYVFYSAIWVETPYYRNTDACAITLKNATIDKSTLGCSYGCVYTESFMAGTQYKSYNYSYTEDVKKKGTLSCLVSGAVATFDLHGSRSEIIALAAGGTTRKYTTDRINLYCYATIDNKKDWTYVVAQGDYWHQESSFSLNPSFSYSAEGASFSISPKYEKDYNHITENALVTYYFK